METTRGITIDGTTFMFPIVKITRKANVLDKYANRTEDGDLKREVIGVYYNYELEIDEREDTPEARKMYRAFWDKLTEPVQFHDVEIPDDEGTYAFKCYISSVEDESKMVYKDRVTYKGLKCKFTAKKPARVPT